MDANAFERLVREHQHMVDRLLVSDSVENLYLRALSRPPTAAERAFWTGDDDAYRKDLFWALLNSKEFGTNH